MSNINLELQPLDSTDIGLIRSWRNDGRIWRWCRQSDVISDAEQVRWFNSLADNKTIKLYKLFVSTPDTSGPVGVAGFTSIDYFNSRAEFSLYIAPEMQGKGLGRRFLEILFTHGFTNLGLNLIYGEMFEGNPAAKTFESLGMTKEGTRRQFYWKDGKRTDAHLYSITRDEWHARNDHHSSTGGEPAGGGATVAPLKRKRGRPRAAPSLPPPETPGAA